MKSEYSPLLASNAGLASPASPPLIYDSAAAESLESPAPAVFQQGSLVSVDYEAIVPKAPPAFTPYEADYFEVGNGDIVSHDPHLNSDGEALYRFLLAQADNRPDYRLHCRGTHMEYRPHWVTTRDGRGHSETRMETFSETVTDFDFYIDASPAKSSPVQWTFSDSQSAYRGLMVREVDPPSGRRLATRGETKSQKNWSEERTACGIPPWVGKTDGWCELNALRSSKTVRQWADEYCASGKYLKEFVYQKVPYGWNIQRLEIAIRSTILTTGYRGKVEVNFVTRGSRVYVRPNNTLSRMLSNKWLKFLSILFLLFPFIWLFKRFHSRGGGRWEVCGAAYPLDQYVAAEERLMQANTSQATDDRSCSRLVGTVELGISEAKWFGLWEDAITRGVLGSYQSPTPLFDAGHFMPLVNVRSFAI